MDKCPDFIENNGVYSNLESIYLERILDEKKENIAVDYVLNFRKLSYIKPS